MIIIKAIIKIFKKFKRIPNQEAIYTRIGKERMVKTKDNNILVPSELSFLGKKIKLKQKPGRKVMNVIPITALITCSITF